MNRSSYDSYGYVEGSGPRSRPVGDLLLNWVLVIAVIGVTAWNLEREWSWYKAELLYYHSVQDGLTPADIEDPFVARGVEANMAYKDIDQGAFFWVKWRGRLPFYVLGLLIPFVIGVARLRRKGYMRWNVPYYVAFVLFVGVSAYFVAKSLQWL